MIHIPETEEDLIPVAVHINMRSRIIVDDMIRWTEIQSQVLRDIYLGEDDQAILSINRISREEKWQGGFQFELLIAFWLGIHYGRIKVINHLIQFDIYLRQLVTLALKGKPERPKGYRPDKKTKEEGFFNKTAGITAENEHLAGLGAPPNPN